MNKQNRRIAIAAFLGMLILILDRKTAFNGAVEGIRLCISTLVPSLFPFFVFTNLITVALSGQALPILENITRICRIPKGAEPILAVGFLGGYPVGAQNVALLHHNQQLSHHDAMRMIAFCNNAGPAFIFGVLSSIFTSRKNLWMLWLVHIISAILVGFILPGSKTVGRIECDFKRVDITDTLAQSIKVMSLVCGWVILMRMVITFLECWFFWYLPIPIQITISGILELSNGCIRLNEIDCEGLRFLIASGLLSLGGICVTLQTICIANDISLKLYFPGKALQCCISLILGNLLQFAFPPESRFMCYGAMIVPVGILFLILLFLQYSEKNSGIPMIIGV